jgi:hypothetical protein
MRTTNTLLKAEKYVNGDPVYKGDPDRIYTSQMVYSVSVTIVKSPEGARLYAMADDDLIAAMQKRKFGQIGALKTQGPEVSSSEILYEAVVPVQVQDVLAVEDRFKRVIDYDKIMASLTINQKGKPLILKDLKAMLEKHRNSNDAIRKRWIEVAQRLQARKSTPEEIKSQKQAVYGEYVSPSLYTIVVSQKITHIVNNPSLKATVVQNANEAYYASVNYKEHSVRKKATTLLPIISIPISSVKEYQTALRTITPKASTLITELRAKGLEDIINSNDTTNNIVKFADLKEHDTKVAKR